MASARSRGVHQSGLKGHPRFYELIDEIKMIHHLKNQDYASQEDPLRNLRASEKIGVPAYKGNFIRMLDKYERSINLIARDFHANVKGESIKDTLKDLAVYALLEIILIEESEEKK